MQNETGVPSREKHAGPMCRGGAELLEELNPLLSVQKVRLATLALVASDLAPGDDLAPVDLVDEAQNKASHEPRLQGLISTDAFEFIGEFPRSDSLKVLLTHFTLLE